MIQLENFNGDTNYNLLEDDDIVNSLTSSVTNKALSALQGKNLNDKFNGIKINSINNALITNGTIRLNIQNKAYATLFTGQQIKEMLGLSSYSYENVAAFVTNGNSSILGERIIATYMGTDGSLSITFNTSVSGSFPINYGIIYNLD